MLSVLMPLYPLSTHDVMTSFHQHHHGNNGYIHFNTNPMNHAKNIALMLLKARVEHVTKSFKQYALLT
jgi:hypothetical protein